MDLSIVIPVYRSAETLSTLFGELEKTLDDLDLEWEIVFVDDAFPDNSWDVIRGLHERFPDRIRAIQLSRNFGQHNALMCGFRHARGKYVVTMDDDLQNPPDEIPNLLRTIEQTGADLVYGVYDYKQHSRARNTATWAAGAFYRFIFRLPFAFTSFRIVRRELLEHILAHSVSFVFIDGLFAWRTDRIARTVVKHRQRTQGRSGYSLGKLARLAVNLFTNFSLVPLQLASWAGCGATILGMFLALYAAIRLLFGSDPVPGHVFTVIAVLVVGGLQLACLGILGEYVGRVHLNINGKPQYAIREICDSTRDREPSPASTFQKTASP